MTRTQHGVSQDLIHQQSTEPGVSPRLLDDDVKDHRLVDAVRHGACEGDQFAVQGIDEGEDGTRIRHQPFDIGFSRPLVHHSC